MTAEEAAEECRNRLAAKLPVGFSPLLILAIISAIFQVLNYCKASAAEVKRRRSHVLTRLCLHRALRDEGFKPLSEEMALAKSAVDDLANEATEEEISAFQQCCN